MSYSDSSLPFSFPNDKVPAIPQYVDPLPPVREQVLRLAVPWEGYQRASVIMQEDLDLILSFDKHPLEVQVERFLADGPAYARVFLSLLKSIAKDDIIQYILTMVDDVLSARPNMALHFIDQDQGWAPLLRLLTTKDDMYITGLTLSILAKFMNSASKRSDFDSQGFEANLPVFTVVFQRVNVQLTDPKTPRFVNAVAALQVMLCQEKYRVLFAEKGGMTPLSRALLGNVKSPNGGLHFQILYRIVYCFWLLTFSAKLVVSFDPKIIYALVSTLSGCAKEKVRRVCLATLANVSRMGSMDHNKEIIAAGGIRVIESLADREWADEDISQDIETLTKNLSAASLALSSWDCYKSEVMGGRLEWGPVHSSEQFWRKNASNFELDDFQVLGALAEIVKTGARDDEGVAVAAHDLGEFMRFHPRGKALVEKLHVKGCLMALMVEGEGSVRKEALLAVQKMLIHDWAALA